MCEELQRKATEAGGFRTNRVMNKKEKEHWVVSFTEVVTPVQLHAYLKHHARMHHVSGSD